MSKSLPFFARATLCEHSVERRLSLVSAVPISGTKELASRTPGIVWHTRSDTFVLIPLLELTRAVAQTVPAFFLILPFAGGLQPYGLGLPARNRGLFISTKWERSQKNPRLFNLPPQLRCSSLLPSGTMSFLVLTLPFIRGIPQAEVIS